MDTPQADVPPGERLARLSDGYLVTQLLRVAAELRVPEALRDGPRSAGELACAVGADAETLHRVLRGLAAEEVLEELPDARFALTPVGELLCADVPGSLRGSVLARGGLYQSAVGGLLAAVRGGGVPFEHVHGSGFFAHVAGRPADLATFQEAQASRSAREAAAVVTAHDFWPYRSLVDVGGGHGILRAAIRTAAPDVSATLFDRPEVVRDAEPPAVGGDFFVEVPAGADAYVLSRVIHDWGDADAVAILRTCRQAMPAHGTLLVVEAVLPERAVEHPAVVRMDLHMLLLVTGRERTAAEFAALLDAAGLRLTRSVLADPATGLHVLEASRA